MINNFQIVAKLIINELRKNFTIEGKCIWITNATISIPPILVRIAAHNSKNFEIMISWNVEIPDVSISILSDRRIYSYNDINDPLFIPNLLKDLFDSTITAGQKQNNIYKELQNNITNDLGAIQAFRDKL